MFINEEQAKKKVCHRTRSGPNRYIDRSCLGSKCMAWTWRRYGDTMIDGNRIGYCRDQYGMGDI